MAKTKATPKQNEIESQAKSYIDNIKAMSDKDFVKEVAKELTIGNKKTTEMLELAKKWGLELDSRLVEGLIVPTTKAEFINFVEADVKAKLNTQVKMQLIVKLLQKAADADLTGGKALTLITHLQ